MNIANYISELLFDYECVILPGLGGFITNEQSATLNRITHQFNPPFSQIFFNVHLKSNDGLLANYLSKREGLSYEEALNQLNEYVDKIQQTLNEGDVFLVDQIGKLSFDQNKNIRFDQFQNVNYNSASFGLSGFISPPIKRKTDEEKLRGLILSTSQRSKAPVDRKQREEEKKRQGGFVKSPMIIAALILFVFSLSWGVSQRDQVVGYWQEQASLFPFGNNEQKYQPRAETEIDTFKKSTEIKVDETITMSQPEEDVAESSNITSEEIIADPNETLVVVSKTEIVAEPIVESKPVIVKEKLVKPTIKPSGKLYYVVAGSFSREVNATKLVDALRQKGYEAIIADTNKNGMYRVAYMSAQNFTLANEKLQAIREEDNAEAWILRK